MNFDTEEVINYFLNDESLYENRKGLGKDLKEAWNSYGPGPGTVNTSKVRWGQVSKFFREEE